MLKNNIATYCDCNSPLNKSIKSLIPHWISKYTHSSSMMDDDNRYIDKHKTISTQCYRSSRINARKPNEFFLKFILDFMVQ